ncbi:MAG TPA: rhodanese-like domain-containing protein [Pyrinomonadaceae bacterium]|jgi:3-mercaptopyruvate sulfurtransferase SseA|nr:rhodanese-like domain-containing protein [Pyrinomonadaceae bacterium]
MRLYISFLAIAFLATSALTGCNSAASTSQTNTAKNTAPAAAVNQNTNVKSGDMSQITDAQDGVARITIAEAKAESDAGKALIVDVRAADSYKAKHIKGAISMPNYETEFEKLPKDKKIITYCS